MNKQSPGIEWTHPFGRPGYTWNPVAGCFHKCRWTMPDNTIAVCYAETTANGVAGNAYQEGFDHHYFKPHKLNEPLKLESPAGIFLDSMSDLMGHWVPDEQIHAVLDMCEKAYWHIFFLLTKNAPRLLKFTFPSNVWVGVSMPPDYFMGRLLDQDKQYRMLDKSLDILNVTRANIRWMSFEPLSWDVAPLLADNAPLEWAVIGAASKGREYYQPNPEHVGGLLQVLDRQEIPVFFKGNLRGNPATINRWREDYPEWPNANRS